MIQNYARDDITFEDPPDPWADAPASGGGGGSQWAGYALSDLRLAWRAGLLSEEQWKAELVSRKMSTAEAGFEIAKQKQTGISTDAKTKGQLTGSEANKVQAIAASGQAQQTATLNSGAPGAQAAVGLLGRLTGNPNLSLTNEQGTLSGTEAPTLESAAPQTQGPGGGTGTGTAAAKKPAGPPDWLSGWVDAFQGFSDDDIIKAYYAGEEGLDRNIVGALLAYRNTKTDAKGVSTNKWTEASLNRYLDQIDAEKPLGITKASLAEQFDPSRADFGARGTFGSGSLGQGIREEGLFTPNSQGFGLVPGSDVSGNLFPAAAVVNNQLYPQFSAMAPDQPKGKYGNWQDENRAFYNGISGIAAQRGMAPGSTLADIGTSLQDQNFFMERYGADPSRANMAVNVASGAYNPANQRIDPSSGRPAGDMNEEELLRLSGQGVFRAQGGPVKAGRPYIVGENRPELFVPQQNGTILPRVPNLGTWPEEPSELPRDFFRWNAKGAMEDIPNKYGQHTNPSMSNQALPMRPIQRAGDPRAGMIPTSNQRLVSENPRRYYYEPIAMETYIPQSMRAGHDQKTPRALGNGTPPVTAPGFPTPGMPGAPTRGQSLFEKALAVSMRRQPMGMMG